MERWIKERIAEVKRGWRPSERAQRASERDETDNILERIQPEDETV